MSQHIDSNAKIDSDSPFHAGEQAFQKSVGKRESIERFGKKVIRPYMPDQHREFFAQLPFIVVGSVDEQGWPWASILPGEPGFINSPDPQRLDLNNQPVYGDPLISNINKLSAPLGFVGVELATRRRNRVNGRVINSSQNGFSIKVDQSFGNCPQYIQTRSVEFIRNPTVRYTDKKVVNLTKLNKRAMEIIANADTFFVASYVDSTTQPVIEGVDVSHRGGQPGFVKIDGNVLTIPDYSGNNHFNTLGNFLLNPKAGLIFADFSTGDIVMLTGSVSLSTKEDIHLNTFKGAERFWQFTLDHGLFLKDALPFRSVLSEYSPNTLLTSNWADSTKLIYQYSNANKWQTYKVTSIRDESSTIRSITLAPNNGDTIMPFKAGQFLSLSLPVNNTPNNIDRALKRNYTVSSSPDDNHYRISIKREEGGLVSNYLHEKITIGDVILAKTPKGSFHIDTSEKRPAVLIAAGVGITPMISMAKHIINEGVRTRYYRPTTILHSAKDSQQRAFYDEFKSLESASHNTMLYFSFLTQVNSSDKPGIDFNGSSRINTDIIQQLLPLADYDFYLCGPSSFVQDIYNGLLSLGVNDKRIFAEAFGPSVLKRKVNTEVSSSNQHHATQATIMFTKSGFEQNWELSDGTLLETAEQHGLTPEFGCRNGSCGSCATKVISGEVTYRTAPTATIADDEVLICCAVPSNKSSHIEIDL